MSHCAFVNPAVAMVILIASPASARSDNALSFFDEVDEPPRTETRTPPRTASRGAPRRRQSGRGPGSGGRGGGRGPGDTRGSRGTDPHQSIIARRAIAAGALLVVIILIAVGVNSCESSARKSALQTYASDV